jgi:hypothetical protein
MFLAAIYPLSEKSALNLSGKVNTNNVTYFEDEAAYYSNAGCVAPKGVTEEGGAAEEKGGDGDDGNEVDVEDGAEEGPAPEIAYDLYRAFWKLQVRLYVLMFLIGRSCGWMTFYVVAFVVLFVLLSSICMPHAQHSYASLSLIIVCATLLQAFFASDQKTIDSADLWRDFMHHARTVVQLFEDSDFTDEELAQARSHATGSATSPPASSTTTSASGNAHSGAVDAVADVEGGEQGRAYSGCKYLTSSQLFSLQLRDPMVRQQVAVQILYFIHYIRYASSAVRFCL